jgi:hypothetical protein
MWCIPESNWRIKCGTKHERDHLRKFNVMVLSIEQSSFHEFWDTGHKMSIKTIAHPLPPYALESDRLKKVLTTAERTQADIVRESIRQMEHVATQSVSAALRLVSKKSLAKWVTDFHTASRDDCGRLRLLPASWPSLILELLRKLYDLVGAGSESHRVMLRRRLGAEFWP